MSPKRRMKYGNVHTPPSGSGESLSFGLRRQMAAAALVVRGADQLQQGQEDLHDVDVEDDGAVDVLLCADLVFAAADDLLRVVHQVLRGRDREVRVVSGRGDSHAADSHSGRGR